MPELLLELLSEEIPARMQARAADDLVRLIAGAFAPLAVTDLRAFHGPRRIALVAEVAAEQPGRTMRERGPRLGAPDAAIRGFLRKHDRSRDALLQEGGYWQIERSEPAVPASALIGALLPDLLRRFPWPKSMRWGSSSFTWVRPLRRILCLLDGAVVPFGLAAPGDDGHGLVSGNLTEGHRFHAPCAFAVASARDWQASLRQRKVMVDAAERRAMIAGSLRRLAEAEHLPWDPANEGTQLLEEVAGLVEWPVVLAGRIDESFMDLPPEVLRVTMRVNQRYFTFVDQAGLLARKFAFVANIEAADGGTAIVAGNERVLRARLADARHFWDQDRHLRLEAGLPRLEQVVFHARLGSQGARVRRMTALARTLAPQVAAPVVPSDRAALLAKADLTSGMVGEFPELQGVMGGYYAANDGEAESVARAIREHYAPKGPDDAVPQAPVSVAVALADKLDLVAGFFAIGEKPSGSSDPFGLRRAALGIIRIVRKNALHLDLLSLIGGWRAFVLDQAGKESAIRLDTAALASLPEQVLAFVVERLRVALRAEGARHDVLAAVFAAGQDGDLLRLLARAEAVATLLAGRDGIDLLTLYRRAANILRIEERKDGPFDGRPDQAHLREPEERVLAEALVGVQTEAGALLAEERFAPALSRLARLRSPLDAFFDRVTVNAAEPELRRNRLYLLNGVRRLIDRVADFSQIESREEEGRA